REAVEKLQRQDVLLRLGQRADRGEDAVAVDAGEDELFGRGRLAAGRLRDLFPRMPAPRGSEVVDREVARDSEEPRDERRPLPLEAVDGLDHPDEGLDRQVLSVLSVPDGHGKVRIDLVEVLDVQGLEGLAAPGLRVL